MEVLSYASCREVSPALEKAEWLFFEKKQTGLAILLPAMKLQHKSSWNSIKSPAYAVLYWMGFGLNDSSYMRGKWMVTRLSLCFLH
ncbi:hypothetical protein NC651_002537 [Populus alba x Populus x berolinensis]|nr:hypothetical protein NC651_002537 [Populus alba x Populus x berolinensis]